MWSLYGDMGRAERPVLWVFLGKKETTHRGGRSASQPACGKVSFLSSTFTPLLSQPSVRILRASSNYFGRCHHHQARPHRVAPRPSPISLRCILNLHWHPHSHCNLPSLLLCSPRNASPGSCPRMACPPCSRRPASIAHCLDVTAAMAVLRQQQQQKQAATKPDPEPIRSHQNQRLE